MIMPYSFFYFHSFALLEKTLMEYDHVGNGKLCTGPDLLFNRVDTPAKCAKMCYGVSSVFAHMGDECLCQLHSKDGVCEKQRKRWSGDYWGTDSGEPVPSEMALFRYKMK